MSLVVYDLILVKIVLKSFFPNPGILPQNACKLNMRLCPNGVPKNKAREVIMGTGLIEELIYFQKCASHFENCSYHQCLESWWKVGRKI